MLVDTSAAVPMLVSGHPAHEAVFAVLDPMTLGLSGHAAFETYSTLTRVPEPARVAPDTAARIIAENFPATVHLTPARARSLLGELPALGIAGGAVYDALVGGAAVEHELRLFTRDRRAVSTYQLLGVDYELLD